MPSELVSKVGRFFSSVKLAIILITVIILASAIGTFIPQGEQPFLDIYHSWWFILLLSLFGLNLLVCSLSRIKLPKRSGLIITHLSILIILIGAIVSALWGKRGFIGIYEGEMKDSFLIGDEVQNLDFKIYLDDFLLEWYDSGNHQISAYIKDRKTKRVFNVEKGKDYPVEGTDYSVEVRQYFPDFYLDSNNIPQTRSEAPNNPALLVRLRQNEKTSQDRWLFANFPSFSEGLDNNLKLVYTFLGRIKDFKSSLKVIEQDKIVLTKTIEVNHPLKFKGYTFYQSRYDPQQPNWTGLEVVRDPGVPLVYGGFILLNIGIIIVFYNKIRRKKTNQ